MSSYTNQGAWRPPAPRILFAVALLLIVVLALGGCASGGGSHGSRGSLSDVAAKAAEEDDEDDEDARSDGPTRTRTDQGTSGTSAEREGRSTGSDGPSNCGGYYAIFAKIFGPGDRSGAESSAQSDSGSEPPFRFDRTNLLLGYTQVFPAGDTIERVWTVSAAFSWYTGARLRWMIGGYYGEGRKGSSPLIQGCMRKLQEYGVDLGGRIYLSDDHTFVGVYALGGLRFGDLRWSYVRDVDVGGGETISSDAVFLFEPYLGFGCAFVQTKSIQAAVNAFWSLRSAAETTNKRFTNDLFADVGALGWQLEFSIFF